MKKILSVMISVLMLFSFSNVYALNEDSSNEVVGTTEFIDENGNINQVNVYDGTTGEEANPYARRVTTANMVNFNCSKAGSTTPYVDYKTGQDGYISKSNGADAAFLGYENGKVKFMMSGVVGLVDASLVEVVSQGTYYASNYEVNSSGALFHYISTNVNALGNSNGQAANYNYVGEAPSYLSKGVEYYSYDGHYFYTNYATMISDYKANVRTNAVNKSNPYYFYYQYLPFRSKTNYTATELNTYINKKANSSKSKLNNTGDIFIKYQNRFGVNAMLAACFAAHESGWGTSSIAINKNNLFGLNATDNNSGGNADTFDTVDDCIYNFTSSWMSKRYLNASYTSRFRGGYFGDKASGIFVEFSSDPYEGEKLASMAANFDAGLTKKDKNYYSIGIKDSTLTTNTSVNVRKESNTSSTILYTTLANAGYAFIVRNKTATNGFYQIQSDSPLASDRNSLSSGADYNYDTSYAYISSNYVTLVNKGQDLSNNGTTTVPITSVTLNKSTLSLLKGTNETLKATINPSNTTDSKTLTWTSSNTSVATVDSTGKVTGVNAGTATITVTTSNKKTATCKVTVTKQVPSVSYQTHVQDYGWQSYVKDGQTSGTTGKSKRLEGIKIKLSNNSAYTGTIQYQAHIQNIGWQGWKSNDEMAGTSGQSKRLEAIQIKLTGTLATNYDIYYRVHAQNFGWLDWAKNGESAGTAGYSYRLEAIEVKLVEKGGKAPGSTSRAYVQRYIRYQTHIQDIGWQENKYDGQTSGTTGKSKRLEAIQINLSNPLYSGSVQYQTHVQDIGWQSWKTDGAMAGTSGKSKRLEAIRIKLTGQMAEKYDIYYRVHAQDYGWLGWAKNGASSGTEGMSKRLEAIEIVLVQKGGSAPGSTANSYHKK